MPRRTRSCIAPCARAAFTAAAGALGGEQLTRVPRGYLKDHPAADYLRYRQYLAGREFDAEFATSQRFYPELLKVFRGIVPLVRFLNTPLRSKSPWELRDMR